jgi:hypothetical protein
VANESLTIEIYLRAPAGPYTPARHRGGYTCGGVMVECNSRIDRLTCGHCLDRSDLGIYFG